MSDGVQLPQANRLETILATVRAVAEGYTSPAEIGQRLGLVDRQGAYYRDAAALLDLISIGQGGHAQVTDRGRRVLDSRDQIQQRAKLRVALRHVEGVGLLLDLLQRSGGECSVGQLEAYLQRWSSHSSSTIARRLSTLLAWMEAVGWVRIRYDQIMLDEDARRFI